MKSSLVSAMIHAGLVGLIALFTPHDVRPSQRPREIAHLVYTRPRTVIDPGVHVGGIGPKCQCVAPPQVIPSSHIPDVDISTELPATAVGTRVIDDWDGSSGERASGGERNPTGVLSADVVDVQVEPYPDAPTPRYPQALREAGIEGQVVLEFVVDTAGRVDRGSIRVIASPADAFVVSIRDALAATRYHPALVGDHRVRQLVHQEFVFALTPH